ncbi:MAG: hypothetical protein QM696_01610 [Steroidobacteraceae bacterium]
MSDTDLQELEPEQRQLAQQLRGVLRDSEQLDSRTANRLARVRARAVAEAEARHLSPWQWASGGLAAAAIIAALTLRFGLPQQWRSTAEPAPAEGLEVLTDDADPEMYEDLDLYRWLAQENGNHA